VTVRGPLINSATGELIGDFLEEQLVRVRRGKSAPVKFDLRPKETVVEISVSGAAKSAGPVALALRGVPTSLRYANEGGVFLYLQPGKHVLLVGTGDRVLERPFEIRSFGTMKLTIDLTRPQEWLFTGSAAAVNAYLEGTRRGPRARARGAKAARNSRKAPARRSDAVTRKQPQRPAWRQAKPEGRKTAGAAALFAAVTSPKPRMRPPRRPRRRARAESAGDPERIGRQEIETGTCSRWEKNGDSPRATSWPARARRCARSTPSRSGSDRREPQNVSALVELQPKRNQLEPALQLEEPSGSGRHKARCHSARRCAVAREAGRGEEGAIWEGSRARPSSRKRPSRRGAARKHRPGPP
jgi:hypothetical protein